MADGLSGLGTFLERRSEDLLVLFVEHLAVVALSVALATVVGVAWSLGGHIRWPERLLALHRASWGAAPPVGLRRHLRPFACARHAGRRPCGSRRGSG